LARRAQASFGRDRDRRRGHCTLQTLRGEVRRPAFLVADTIGG